MLQRFRHTLIYLASLLLWLGMGSGLALAQSVATLDLSHWDENKTVDIVGPWDFFWNQELTPENELRPAEHTLAAGMAWNDLPLGKGSFTTARGLASYRIVLHGLTRREDLLHIKIFDVASAARIYLYPLDHPERAVRSDMGRVAIHEEAERPTRQSTVLAFVPDGGDWVLLIQISNHHAQRGGMWKTPTLGTASTLRRQELTSFLQTAAAVGVMLAIGIYSLLIWIRHRENLESLALFFVSFGSLLRAISVNEIFLSISPDGAYHFFRSLEYATLFLGPLAYSLFLQLSFFGAERHRYQPYLLGFGIVLGIIPLISPQRFYAMLLPINQLFLVILILSCLFTIGRAVYTKQKHAMLALAGIGFILLGFAIDYLYQRGLLNVGFYTMPSFISLFLLLQAQIVAAHSAEAFFRAEFLGKELVEKEKARTLFFHNTSHELRTPLNGIIGFLDLVCQGHYGSISPQAGQQIAKALRLAESLKNQVNTILDLAKSRRGELALQAQQLNLSSLFHEAQNLAEGLCLKAENLKFSSELKLGADAYIGDQDKIFTLIRNLLGNAFKFRDPQRENHVHLLLSCENNLLLLEVSDTGIGIPEEAREKIFDEFAQVQGDARRGYEGTGLGLTMVRDLVKLMGGSIELQSTVGEGSRFTLRLPSASPDLLSATTTASQESTAPQIHKASLDTLPQATGSTGSVLASDSYDGTGWEVMVIDDNETNCEVITGILQVDHYEVRHAISGRVGLDMMRRKRPDVLLLDMMMPEMSGEDVLHTMRADPLLLEIPVILITARASEEDRIEGLKLGADDYLAKPIFAAELRLRVRNMVQRHQLLRQAERSHHEDKIFQLGELFGDLSHELKNILNSASSTYALESTDGLMSAAVLSLPEDLQRPYGEALIKPSLASSDSLSRMNMLQQLLKAPLSEDQNSVAFFLADLALELSTTLEIWKNLSQTEEVELHFAASQMKIFYQYKILMGALSRSKELTFSVLAYTRNDGETESSSLCEVWRQTLTLINARMRMVQMQISAPLPETYLHIPPSRLIQIFINLCLNALDAVESLPLNERWLHLVCQQKGSELVLEFSNGGPAIPVSFQAKLFQRGMSSKGTKGSGIGLYVSRRLCLEVGGDLNYVEGLAHPCFRLRLPLIA